jgi:hypothetical protein
VGQCPSRFGRDAVTAAGSRIAASSAAVRSALKDWAAQQRLFTRRRSVAVF